MNIKTEHKLNQNTHLLKLIAIITMTIDHVGVVFFPDSLIFRAVGRLAFLLFAYGITMGVIHTTNIKKYFLRLFILGIISQPIYLLTFSFNGRSLFSSFLYNPNIYFTLILGLLAVYGLQIKNMWMTGIAIFLSAVGNVEYSIYGMGIFILLYLSRNRDIVFSIVLVLWILMGFIGGSHIFIFGHYFSLQGLAILSLPLIYIPMNYQVRLNKYFFYFYYPLHLLIIYLVKLSISL